MEAEKRILEDQKRQLESLSKDVNEASEKLRDLSRVIGNTLTVMEKKMNEILEQKEKNMMIAMDERKKTLDEQEEAVSKMSRKLRHESDKVKEIIKFNVGGTSFTTTRKTIMTHKQSYLAVLLESGKYPVTEDGSYFIDRNPDYFKIILEYLRTGLLPSKLDRDTQRGISTELQFYHIPPPSALVPTPLDSKLLNPEHTQTIQEWLPYDKKLGKCLYRASEHGFGAATFHKQCDNQGSTVVVIQAKGFLFGGYADNKWTSSPNCVVNNKNNFIFTLTNPHNIPPTKLLPKNMITGDSTQVCYSNWGPSFGANDKADISVADNSNTKLGSHTEFPSHFVDTTGKGNILFTGARNFISQEIEVFQLESC